MSGKYSAIWVFQQEVSQWADYNFGETPGPEAVLGLTEEAGEVARASLKMAQNIRGTKEEWLEEIKKECGDVFIKLCDIARVYGFDLDEAIYNRWDVVSQRNWRDDPNGHGIEKL